MPSMNPPVEGLVVAVQAVLEVLKALGPHVGTVPLVWAVHGAEGLTAGFRPPALDLSRGPDRRYSSV